MGTLKSISSLLLFSGVVFGSTSLPLFADEIGPGAGRGGSVVVQIRTVEASEASPDQIKNRSEHLNLDRSIEDLRSKLQKLHFKNFRLLGAQSQKVPLMQKTTVALVNGQSLTVRPLYISDSRIGMWLKWRDGAGAEILDTRMHFDSGESMIAGSEGDLGRGTILAIDVTDGEK